METIDNDTRPNVDNACWIELSQDKWALIDAVLGDKCPKFNVLIQKRSNTYYAIRRITTETGKVSQLLHQYVWEYYGMPLTKLIDHKNGNGWDCRIENLRPANHKQNAANCQLRKDNTSGYKGVTYSKRKCKYQARIKINGKEKHLGYFETAIDAAKARDKAALLRYGEYELLNFPSQIESKNK